MHQSVTQAGRQADRQAGRQASSRRGEKQQKKSKAKQSKAKAKQSAGCGGGAESLQTPHHPSSTALVRVDVLAARPITIAIVVVSIIGKAGRKR